MFLSLRKRITIGLRYLFYRASLLAQTVKNLPAMQETQVPSLGQEDPLEKGMATHVSMGSHRVRQDSSDLAYTHTVCVDCYKRISQTRCVKQKKLSHNSGLAGRADFVWGLSSWPTDKWLDFLLHFMWPSLWVCVCRRGGWGWGVCVCVCMCTHACKKRNLIIFLLL